MGEKKAEVIVVERETEKKRETRVGGKEETAPLRNNWVCVMLERAVA